MPQTCQIIGVNSVTNIELDKGFMPAPIIRNADWFGKLIGSVSLNRILCRQTSQNGRGHACRFDHCSLSLQDSGNWPIY